MPVAATGRLVLFTLALSALGCGKHVLEGSLTEVLDLSYTSASILITGTETSVRFTRPRGTGEDTVLNVALKIEDLELVPHGDIPLEEQAASGGQRGVVTRNVLDDPHRNFPTLERGNLRFESVPETGRTVQGTFSVTFKQCVEFGCGRTVFGDFTAKVPQP